jgi:ABC-type spermidine/putrescine transport system permease subunit I
MSAITEAGVEIGPVYRRRPAWLAAWPLFPILIYLGVLFLYPVIQLLWLSIVDETGVLSDVHYTKLFARTTYVKVLGITFRIAAWTTLFSMLAGYPVAYLLATTTERWRNNLVLWVLLPFWTSFLVRTFAWIVLLGRNGTINTWLQDIGITDAPIRLIYNFAGVMIGMVHALMPLAVLTILAVMQTIDPDLRKAAATLGGRGGQSFWRIYFPLSLPGVAAGGLLVFITALGFFITPALLGSGREILIAQVIIEQVEELLNWGFAGAVAVLLLATALVIFYIYDRMLGMSTLAGSSELAERSAGASVNPIGRLSSWMGRYLISAAGWVCDLFSETYEKIRPLRADRRQRGASRAVLWVVALAVIVYLAAPSFFVVPVSFSENQFIEWPVKGFTLHWYDMFLSSNVYVGAMIRSFVVGIFAATLSMLIGVPAAFVLARQRLLGRTAALAFILSPLIVPRIIIAIAIFYLYAKIGLVGTSLGLVLGHTVLCVPFVVVTVMAVLKNYDERLDHAAWTLGASKARTLRYITFPLIRPGLIAAFLFAFVTSFDELTIALFVSGGTATTLPKQMWTDALLKVSPTVLAVSTVVLILITAVILLAEYARRRSTQT